MGKYFISQYSPWKKIFDSLSNYYSKFCKKYATNIITDTTDTKTKADLRSFFLGMPDVANKAIKNSNIFIFLVYIT